MKFFNIFFMVFFSQSVFSSLLDDAVDIVVYNSEILNSYKYKFKEENKWSAKISFRSGYSLKSTSDIASGLDAGAMFVFEIPLFDGNAKKDNNNAKRISNLIKLEKKIKDDFVSDVEAIILKKSRACIANELYMLKEDKLKYFKELQKTGGYEANKLWSHALSLKGQEHVIFDLGIDYNISLVKLSMKYGGKFKNKIHSLINKYINNFVVCH